MKRFQATCISALVGLATFLPAKGNAADFYVSSAGTYDGKEAETDLQAAIDKATDGDTIWVEDGFVCESGMRKWHGQPSRVVIEKAVTVRSRSGSLENQPVIRGAIDPTGRDGHFGKAAIRGVVLNNDKAALVGFRVEGGAAVNGDGNPINGGGIHGRGLVKNCYVVGNHGLQGGGIAWLDSHFPRVEGSIVTNNDCITSGGGAFYAIIKDSQLIGNRSSEGGGGAYCVSATRCLIANNVAKSGGGCVGFADRPLVDCVISNNTATWGGGGGVSYNPALVDCLVISNRCAGPWGNGGGATGTGKFSKESGYAIRSTFIGNESRKAPGQTGSWGCGGAIQGIVAEQCRMIGNLTEGMGGGAARCVLVDCLLEGNVASNSVNWTFGEGGGFSNCHATNCVVTGNAALSPGVMSAGYGCGGGVDNDAEFTIVNCVVTNNFSDARGGGVHYGTTINCLIAGNTTRGQGGGVFAGTHYNGLIVDNVASNSAGGAGWDAILINSTVAGNEGPQDLNYVTLVNTAAYGAGKDASGWVRFATNCCAACVDDKLGPGNITANPKLGTEGAMRFVPQPGSPCIDAGLLQSWMTDSKNPGFRDRNGRRRVIGPGVDIGALEAPFWGTRIFIR